MVLQYNNIGNATKLELNVAVIPAEAVCVRVMRLMFSIGIDGGGSVTLTHS